MASSHYDHVTDLANGRVPVEGVDLTFLTLQIEEIFFRQFNYGDFDASEVSMGKYCSLVSQGNSPLVAHSGVSVTGAAAFLDLHSPRRPGEDAAGP